MDQLHLDPMCPTLKQLDQQLLRALQSRDGAIVAGAPLRDIQAAKNQVEDVARSIHVHRANCVLCRSQDS